MSIKGRKRILQSAPEMVRQIEHKTRPSQRASSLEMDPHQAQLQASMAMQERLHRLCVRFHFADVYSLRNTMAQSGAIISGSAALAVLQWQMQEPSDIDFYVPPMGLAQLLKFVLAHGYELTTPTLEEKKYPSRLVLKLLHPVSAACVDIVVPAKHVVEEVTEFHSTVVMNYVTYYGVVSLYPTWTMARMGAVIKEGAEESGCIQKYRDRGFTMVNDPSLLPRYREGQPEGLELQMKRNTFDEETLFIPFDNIAPSLPAFEAREISWTLCKACTVRGDQEYNIKETEHVRTRLTNASNVVVT